MPRPRCPRRLACPPDARVFKPRGIPLRALEEVALGFDELESLRLADLEGLYHEDAAARMEISRATFGRVVAEARRKVAQALVEGKALRIDGGDWKLSASGTARGSRHGCWRGRRSCCRARPAEDSASKGEQP